MQALSSLGVAKADVLELCPYKLHADRIGSNTVITAQGTEAPVSLTSFVSYRPNALGMRDGIVNTAGTRAQHLALFVVDVEQLRANVPKVAGIRKLLERCPHLPWNVFCDLCLNNDMAAMQEKIHSHHKWKIRRNKRAHS